LSSLLAKLWFPRRVSTHSGRTMHDDDGRGRQLRCPSTFGLGLFEQVGRPVRDLKRVPMSYVEADYVTLFSHGPQEALDCLRALQLEAHSRGQRLDFRKRIIENVARPRDKDTICQKAASRGGALHTGPPSKKVREVGAAIMSHVLEEDPDLAWGNFCFDEPELRQMGLEKAEQPIVAAMAHANVEVCGVMFNHPSCDKYLKDSGEMTKLDCGLRELIIEMHRHIEKKIRGRPAKGILEAIKGETETPEGREVLERRYMCLKMAYAVDAKRHGKEQRMLEQVMYLKTGRMSLASLMQGYIRFYHDEYSKHSWSKDQRKISASAAGITDNQKVSEWLRGENATCS